MKFILSRTIIINIPRQALDSSLHLLLWKKNRWIPASGKETLDSSLHNDHTLGMKPRATVCSFMKQDLKSNLTVQFIMYCTVACLHSTRIINLRVNQNIIYTGRAPRIMYRNAAVQRRPLQPSVSKPIYRGYLGCKKRVEKNPRRVCELNSKRWPWLSLHKIAVFGGSTSVLHICGYVFVDAVRGRSLCNECRL